MADWAGPLSFSLQRNSSQDLGLGDHRRKLGEGKINYIKKSSFFWAPAVLGILILNQFKLVTDTSESEGIAEIIQYNPSFFHVNKSRYLEFAKVTREVISSSGPLDWVWCLLTPCHTTWIRIPNANTTDVGNNSCMRNQVSTQRHLPSSSFPDPIMSSPENMENHI